VLCNSLLGPIARHAWTHVTPLSKLAWCLCDAAVWGFLISILTAAQGENMDGLLDSINQRLCVVGCKRGKHIMCHKLA
jgi:hypothetical protein